MSGTLDVAFFGSSLVSSYWNGAATYYRGIVRNLAALGHRVTFFEPDAYERQQHRDMDDPPWARVVVYEAAERAVRAALEEAADADVMIKASGVGVFDELLEEAVPETARPDALTVFWDVDAPATLARLAGDPTDAFHALLPRYDLVLTYGGGDRVVRRYRDLGARQCHVVYNALDPETHHRVGADPRFASDLALLANRLPDREERIGEFFLRPASLLPDRTFLLGGAGWDDRSLPPNVRLVGHVSTRDHNAFNSTPTCVLNVHRESMVRNGYSPATRLFEAAGAGGCMITDDWEGIELFLQPGTEILVARDGREVADHVRDLEPRRARAVGDAALRRVLAEHTYEHRARDVDAVLRERVQAKRARTEAVAR